MFHFPFLSILLHSAQHTWQADPFFFLFHRKQPAHSAFGPTVAGYPFFLLRTGTKAGGATATGRLHATPAAASSELKEPSHRRHLSPSPSRKMVLAHCLPYRNGSIECHESTITTDLSPPSAPLLPAPLT
jgi:hypothetical protein